MNKPKIIPDFPAVNLEYLTADANYTVLHFRSGERLISGYSLGVFEALFEGKSFVRIDRSNLVN
jgi:two-component system LytT family response regulator